LHRRGGKNVCPPGFFPGPFPLEHPPSPWKTPRPIWGKSRLLFQGIKVKTLSFTPWFPKREKSPVSKSPLSGPKQVSPKVTPLPGVSQPNWGSQNSGKITTRKIFFPGKFPNPKRAGFPFFGFPENAQRSWLNLPWGSKSPPFPNFRSVF